MNSVRIPALTKPVPILNDLVHFSPFPEVVVMPPAFRQESRMRILIAEDDPVSCQVLATRLEKWGYETVITRDGREAMSVMRSADAPGLAVLDWMMPGMDGLEVCRRLREIDKVVYIIFLTSLGAKENVLEALEAGADDYLLKPFDALALQTRIRVGLRIINLQKVLAARVKELEMAAAELQDIKQSMYMPL
jgi:DNA-binding response OmpR family regulator